jgi:chromosome segregation protein
MTVSDDVIDRLEAEAEVADADAEELTIAVESDVKETEQRVEELESEVQEKESKVEELQAEVEELEAETEEQSETVEELEDEIVTVKEHYAEELAEGSSVLDEDDLMERFEVSELREKYDSLDDETESDPAPNSADSGPNVKSPDDEGDDGGDTEELSERKKVAAEAWEARGDTEQGADVWEELAEDIRNEEGD